MSARAIKALRGETGLLPGHPASEADGADEDENSSSEEDELSPPSRPSAFATMMMDDDDNDDESSSEESASEHDINRKIEPGLKLEEATPAELEQVVVTPKSDKSDLLPEEQAEAEEEDLDALLDEFKEHDEAIIISDEPAADLNSDYFRAIMDEMDVSDLDVEYTLRTSLLGSLESGSQIKSRRKRQGFLFGPPKDGWIRPPRYVGGGIGMTTYDQEASTLPWPYNDDSLDIIPHIGETAPWKDPARWFTFMHSDSYAHLCKDYETIKQTGDLNSLILFVAHHPYVTEALLQLTIVLYQVNRSQEGLSLLRRSLWIYENASLLSFSRGLNLDRFMDFDLPENSTFAKALFRLQHVSYISGVTKTSLAVCKYILSLDPLRDNLNVLPIVDQYALSSNAFQWVVDFVKSGTLNILFKDERVTYSGTLLDMPNWSYSYALSLFRLSRQDDEMSEVLLEKANAAIQNAINRFPDVVGRLLQEINVDTTGRSFRRDWILVLDFASNHSRTIQRSCTIADGRDPITNAATLQACDALCKIYVEHGAKFWEDDAALQWLYTNLQTTMSHPLDIVLPHPALMRYTGCQPGEYEAKIQLLPEDANILDPGLINHAMAVDPNRRRFLRNMPQQPGLGDDNAALGLRFGGANNLLGRPTQVVDPDWPLVEVFWRSFLPWNTVGGIPPPPR